MSGHSSIGHYHVMGNGVFDADEPVSTLRSWVVRSNAQHLIDVAGQYCVNWAADISSEGLHHDEGISGGTPAYVSWEFPVRMQEEGRPPNFDLLISAQLEAAGSAFVLAAIGPADAPRERMGGENDQQWFRVVEEYTSTSVDWAIDEQLEWATDDRRYLSAIRSHPVTENGSTSLARVVWARLEVLLLGVDAELESHVWSVMLREYCS